MVSVPRLLLMTFIAARARLVSLALPGSLALAFGVAAVSQQTTPANPAPPDGLQQPAAQAPTSPGQDAAPQQAAPAAAEGPEAPGGITEDELRQLLVGKELYLRGGYLGDSIAFNEHGKLTGHAANGSYTLCGVRIEKVRLSKHKVELEGARYGLHFLGGLPYEDPTKTVDRVKITPKKKVLRLTIDREIVVRPKKVKGAKPAKGAAGKTGPGAAAKAGAGGAPPETGADAAGQNASASAGQDANTPAKPDASASAEPAEMSEADQLKAEIAAAPAADRPADLASVTTTTSPAHAKKVLLEALSNVFASGVDDRMLAQMPQFWKLYYQAAEAKTDFRPADPAVMRQTTVDQKAKLLSTFEPASNEFAQAAGVAGMALYHVVVGADGKPEEIAVARPIGFGLDENAVDSIGKASFAPAVKDGKPVPVLLDLVVQFRIYSKRTALSGGAEAEDKASGPALPGPYSAQHP